jgi:type II secretory pathway component PulM
MAANPFDILRRPFAYVAGEWSRMPPRERRLVGILGGSALGVAVVFVVVLVMQYVADKREGNAAAREALASIAKYRDDYLEAKARMLALEVRLGNEPPQLAADLEAAASEADIKIREATERPTAPAGKRYLEHTVDVSLQQVDLLKLSKFLSKLETGRRMIVVSKLTMKRRFAEGDKLDVTLTATTYERVKEDRALKRRPGTGAAGAAKEKT